MKYRLVLLLSLALLSSSATAKIEPLLGFGMDGTDMLVCGIPIPKEEGSILGDTNCVIHDLDRKMQCAYNFNTKKMICYRMRKAL